MDFYLFDISADSFLERTRRHLEQFDNGEPESLFYAALNLRFGIESRLYTYLDVTYSVNELPSKPPKEYIATKLLKRLTEIDPDADKGAMLTITCEQTGSVNAFEYTPVTPRLAKMHGQLGELLDAKFFRNNQYWMIPQELRQDGEMSLLDYRHFLIEVADELAKATRGALLHNPKFTELVQQVTSDAAREDV